MKYDEKYILSILIYKYNVVMVMNEIRMTMTKPEYALYLKITHLS